jgi:hypothetical protein
MIKKISDKIIKIISVNTSLKRVPYEVSRSHLRVDPPVVFSLIHVVSRQKCSEGKPHDPTVTPMQGYGVLCTCSYLISASSTVPEVLG